MTDAKVLFNHHSSPSVNEDYSLSEAEFINALAEDHKDITDMINEMIKEQDSDSFVIDILTELKSKLQEKK